MQAVGGFHNSVLNVSQSFTNNGRVELRMLLSGSETATLNVVG